jgi:hypothetical protein
MLGGLLVEFLGYWMVEGWLAGGLSGGGWGWLGWLLGDSLATGTPEPREAGPVRVMRLFGEPEPTQLSRRNHLSILE